MVGMESKVGIPQFLTGVGGSDITVCCGNGLRRKWRVWDVAHGPGNGNCVVCYLRPRCLNPVDNDLSVCER